MEEIRYAFSYTNYEEIDADGKKEKWLDYNRPPKLISKTGMFNYLVGQDV